MGSVAVPLLARSPGLVLAFRNATAPATWGVDLWWSSDGLELEGWGLDTAPPARARD